MVKGYYLFIAVNKQKEIQTCLWNFGKATVTIFVKSIKSMYNDITFIISMHLRIHYLDPGVTLRH